MVMMFGVEMAVYFSPDDLGLCAEMSGTVFEQSGLDYGLSSSGPELSSCVCFGLLRNGLSGY